MMTLDEMPVTVQEEWKKLRPLVEEAEFGLDYDVVASVMGWSAEYARKRVSRLRLRYGLPIPTVQETLDWGRCPVCDAPLRVWLDGRWCPACGWDEGSEMG